MQTKLSVKQRLTFDGFVLDQKNKTLTYQNEAVPIQSLVFELLWYLARRPDVIVSKEELLENVWGHTFLTDSSIAQAIKKARTALGDDGQQQNYIKTVHGKGFMFVGQVMEPAVKTASTPKVSRTKWMAAFAALVLIIAGIGWLGRDSNVTSHETVSPLAERNLQPTLLILPFQNDTGDADLDWFEHGLASTSQLLLEQTGVFKRVQTVFHDEVLTNSVPDTVAFLGADWGLKVSVSRLNQQFNVEWSLHSSTDSPHAGRFETADATTVARRITEHLIDQLEGRLALPVQSIPELSDPFALELYSRGVEALKRDQILEARSLLAAAKARLPQSVAIHMKLIQARYEESNFNETLAAFEALLNRVPTDALHQRTLLTERMGDLFWYQGNVEQASHWLKLSLETVEDPWLKAKILNSLAFVEQSQLQFQRAWDSARQAEVLLRKAGDPYLLSLTLTNLGYLAEDMGRIEQAGQFHREALSLRERHHLPSLIAASQYGLARIERRSGHFDQALSLISASLKIVETLNEPFNWFDNLEELAEIQMHQGQFDAAMMTIEQASALAVESNDDLGQAWARQALLRWHLRQKRVDENVLQEASELPKVFAEMGEEQDAFLSELEHIEALLLFGQTPSALAAVEALENHPAIDNPVLEVRYQLLQAWGLVLSGDASAAAEQYKEVLKRTREIGALDLEAQTALQWATLTFDHADFAETERLLAIAEAWSTQFMPVQGLRIQLDGRASP